MGENVLPASLMPQGLSRVQAAYVGVFDRMVGY